MTSTQSDHDSIAVLEAQLRECYGRVLYSHKAQEKSADSCTRVLRRVKLWQVILSSIVTAGFIPVIFTDPGTMKTAAIATAFLAGTLLALNLYWKESNPGRQAQLHKDTANQLWMIRESYLSLLTDLRSGALLPDALRQRRDELQTALGHIYTNAPNTGPKSYRAAVKGLKQREELTFSDEELDLLLPTPLRKTLRPAAPSESRPSGP